MFQPKPTLRGLMIARLFLSSAAKIKSRTRTVDHKFSFWHFLFNPYANYLLRETTRKNTHLTLLLGEKRISTQHEQSSKCAQFGRFANLNAAADPKLACKKVKNPTLRRRCLFTSLLSSPCQICGPPGSSHTISKCSIHFH